MRLLAKTVEEPYQTAVGLAADLRRCLTEWETRAHIDAFPLGTHDVSDRLLIPEKRYGREVEIDALLATFDRVVAHGTAEFVLVSGYSGIGKPSVVNELHRVLVPPHGLFAKDLFLEAKKARDDGWPDSEWVFNRQGTQVKDIRGSWRLPASPPAFPISIFTTCAERRAEICAGPGISGNTNEDQRIQDGFDGKTLQYKCN
jgi:hypothetical protein